tara:strand:+ start:147 stop:788 length:642 start_codon:yes stop_codon:yes gene_type:complete
MSFTALDWAVKQKVGNSTEKLILLCLANYSDDNNKSYPSHKTISKFAEVSNQTVIKCLTKLKNKNLLFIEPRYQQTLGNKNRQTSNLYTLNIPPYENDIGVSNTATQPPIKKIQPINNNNKTIYNNEFEVFWNTYPNRPNDNKYGAFQKYSVIIKNKEITFEDLITKTQWFAKTQEGKDVKFIPHCKTWLVQKRFLDVEKPTIKKTNLNMLVG